MRIASVMHKNPISSLNRLFPVGVSKRKEGLLSIVGKAECRGGMLALSQPRLEELPNTLNIANYHLPKPKTLCARVSKGSVQQPRSPRQHQRAHDDSVHGERRKPVLPRP